MNTKGIKVVLKFFHSIDPNGNVKLISRTMGKLALIENQYQGQVNDDEFWLCEIEKEIGSNKNRGAFLVRPIDKIEVEKIKKLLPNFYSIIEHGKTAFLYPKNQPKEPWILSANTRKIFNDKYTSVIVPIEE